MNKQLLKCPVCADGLMQYKSLLHLQVHCITVHPSNFFTCPWCAISFDTVPALENHARICTAFETPQEIEAAFVNDTICTACTEKVIFASNEIAIDHYKYQHLMYRYVCSGCEHHFDKKSTLYSHYASCHATRNILNADVPKKQKRHIMKQFNRKICFNCKIEFKTISKTAKHYKNVHGKEIVICDACGKGYLSLLALRIHKQKNCRPVQKEKKKRGRPAKGNKLHLQNIPTANGNEQAVASQPVSVASDNGNGQANSPQAEIVASDNANGEAQIRVKVEVDQQTMLKCKFCAYETMLSDCLKTHTIEKHRFSVEAMLSTSTATSTADNHTFLNVDEIIEILSDDEYA